MKNTTKTEAFLSELEKALGSIHPSDKAEIILAAKSHILAALEREPAANVDKILATFGSAVSVANRYLHERGLQPTPTSHSSVWKWLGLGMIGFGLFSVAVVIFLFMKFTPLFTVDEKSNRVTLFGGTIDINELEGTVHIGSSVIGNNLKTSEYSGQKILDEKSNEVVSLEFTNGKFIFTTAPNNQLKWSCKTKNQPDHSFLKEQENAVLFDFTHAASANCRLEIPKNTQVNIKGPNGNFTILKPEFPVSAEITNGNVSIVPGKDVKYRFDLSVVNGVIDDFESSPDKDSIAVKIALVNGKIGIEAATTDDKFESEEE